MNRSEVIIIDLDRLHVVDESKPADVAHAERELRTYGVWQRPLVARASSLKILFGGDYHTAACRLGLKAVPVVLLDNELSRTDRQSLSSLVCNCCIPIDHLMQVDSAGNPAREFLQFPLRHQILDVFFAGLLAKIEPSLVARLSAESHEIRSIVPHPRLRLVLKSEPVMASILPCSPCRFSLGDAGGPPFRLQPGRLIRLSPALLDDPQAMAAAARWGLEAALVLDSTRPARRYLGELLRHGGRLVSMLPPESRDLFLSLLPGGLADELIRMQGSEPGLQLLAWQASLLADLGADESESPLEDACELAVPLEDILVSGGDSRLELDVTSGVNKYGVPPRPRPEAIHFSSSTASAISDYGFLYGEMLRQELLRLVRQGCTSTGDLLSRTVNAISGEICRMIDLGPGEADVALAPSGTDTELIAVMLALAGAEGRKLTNILIAPEESGRGVALAGAGCYFDDIAATGLQVEKASPAWPDASIALEVIDIRDHDAQPKKPDEIDKQFLELGRRALAEDEHILAHVLWASKTGIVAPSQAAVEQLIGLGASRVDVVIDACQMRMDFTKLGSYLRQGWLLQISGSKFLTGPPFSGALILPRSMRRRIQAISAAMEATPAVTHADAWTTWWSTRLPQMRGAMGFGPLFRWLPALLEATLFKSLPQDFCAFAFERFRQALATRVDESPFLQPISPGELLREDELFARLSIVSFQVLGRQASGELVVLGEAECRWLFERLNLDAEPLLPGLAQKYRTLARQQAHIGQPVTLHSESGPITVMRMVIGARFFSIVGYAGTGAITAALESEIADAERAISKIELLAANWSRIAPSNGVRQ